MFYHWEDDPDFEAIKAGLNWGSHLEGPFDEILAEVTPIFQNPPEELDETWRHGSLVGGICEFDPFALADSYKLAGDTLVDAVPTSCEAYELIYPIAYNYRHATELYFKAVLLPPKKDHNLTALLNGLRELLWTNYQSEIPAWFEKLVLSFNDIDPDSTTFRYGESGPVLRCG